MDKNMEYNVGQREKVLKQRLASSVLIWIIIPTTTPCFRLKNG